MKIVIPWEDLSGLANNKQSNKLTTVSVYTPPNVAKGGCNIFDAKTGKMSHVAKCGYYSAYGKLLSE